MNIAYKTDNVTLTDEVQNYAEEKLAAIHKLLSHHDEADIECDVALARDDKHHTGMIYRADFTVLAGKERMHGVGHGESMNAALDMAKDELANRLRRDKKAHVRFLRKSGAMLKSLVRFGRE